MIFYKNIIIRFLVITHAMNFIIGYTATHI